MLVVLAVAVSVVLLVGGAGALWVKSQVDPSGQSGKSAFVSAVCRESTWPSAVTRTTLTLVTPMSTKSGPA
jgi:hypothetical protein